MDTIGLNEGVAIRVVPNKIDMTIKITTKNNNKQTNKQNCLAYAH